MSAQPQPISDPDGPPSEGSPAGSEAVPFRCSNGEEIWVTHDFAVIAKREPRGHRSTWYRRHGDLIAGAGALVLVAVVAGLFIGERVREDAALIATGRLAEPAPVAREAEPLATLRAGVEKEIEDTVKAWASTWSRQDPEAYLDFYSARFVLPEGMSRYSWESLRSLRLQSVRDSSVSLGEIEASVIALESATARFVMTFSTPYSRDRVAKTLALIKESGRWKILEERSVELEKAS